MLDQQKNTGTFAVHGAAKSNRRQARTKLDMKQALCNVILRETNALKSVAENIPDSALILIDKILSSTGKVVFSGIGKSGLVGQKLAATFSSLGIPSIFLHSCNALHGDLGVVQPQDILIALSKSATGAELENMLAFLHNNKNFTTLICCNKGELCNLVNLVVQLPFEREACFLNLAPTSSSTVMMAFGDALAVVISSLRNFDKNCFARFHPSGVLGKRLLLTVKHFMHSGQSLPSIEQNTSFSEVICTISAKKLGVGVVVDGNKNVLGIITDGDLRRACDRFGPDVFIKKAADIMTLNPKTIKIDELAYNALNMMESFNITNLIVADNKTVAGVIHIHDLIKAGIKE